MGPGFLFEPLRWLSRCKPDAKKPLRSGAGSQGGFECLRLRFKVPNRKLFGQCVVMIRLRKLVLMTTVPVVSMMMLIIVVVMMKRIAWRSSRGQAG